MYFFQKPYKELEMKRLLLFFLLLPFCGFSQDDVQKAQDLFNIAIQYSNEGNYEQAIKNYEQAAKFYQDNNINENFLICEINISDLLIKLGRATEARTKAEKILPNTISTFGRESQYVAHLYTVLGRAYFMLSQFDQAKQNLYYAINLSMETNGTANDKTAFIMGDLALIYANTGIIDSAIFYNKKSIEILTANHGDNSPLLVYPLINLSNLYITLGKINEAIAIKKQIIDITTETRGEVTEEVGEAYSGLGNAYLAKGEYELAKQYLLKSNQIFTEIYGEDNYKLSANYINLGNLYNKTGNFDFALQYYFLAIKNMEKNKVNASNFPGLYNDIALVSMNQGNDDNAILYLNKALKIKKKQNQTKDLQTASIYSNLGRVYQHKGDTAKAIVLYLKSIQISETLFGLHNPSVLKSYTNLANLYYEQNNLDSAEFYIAKSINANLKSGTFSLDNLQSVSFKNYYDGVELLATFRILLKIYHYRYILDPKDIYIKKNYVIVNKADTLISDLRTSFFIKADRIRFNAEVSHIYDYAVNMLFSYKDIFSYLPDWNDKVFYFMEKNKTSTLLQGINEQKVRNFSSVPDSILNYENNIRENIIIYSQKLSESETPNEQNFYRDLLITQQFEYQKLIQLYKKEYPDYYHAKFNPEVASIAEIQSILNDSTAVLEYLVTHEFLYVVVITQNSQNFYVTPFGATDISNIKQFNASLLTYNDKNIKIYKNLAFELYKKLLFFDIDQNLTNLIIIPDDIISTVPFEALLTEKPKNNTSFKDLPYLIKKHTISNAFSASVFYEIATKSYENDNRKDILAIAPVFKPDNQQTFDNSDIQMIEGTEIEVKNIENLFEQSSLNANILLDKEANEYKIKKILTSDQYKIIHIATHGFVNFENPELSALILSKDNLNTEDGILYSGEIYNMRFNADLVTLSACETARGKITKGEGVIGLSQAFVYAGSRNLIISLWKVSDLATTELMTKFYTELLDENPGLTGDIRFAQALRQAKLKMINTKFSHPYFWSAFILIGR